MRFCSYCGQPLDPVTQECPVCGGYKTQDFSDKFVNALKTRLCSPLMLAFCIVYSASVLLKMFDSDNIYSQLLNLLMPIACWITFFSACSRRDTMSMGGLKFASIIVTIARIIIWIMLAILLLTAIIIIAVPTFVTDFVSYIIYAFPEYEVYASLLYESASSIILMIGIGLIITVFILTLLNIFLAGSISKSIKSIIDSFKYSENRLNKFKTVKIWLIIIGCCNCMYSFSNITFANILYVITLFVGAFLADYIANAPSDDFQQNIHQ